MNDNAEHLEGCGSSNDACHSLCHQLLSFLMQLLAKTERSVFLFLTEASLQWPFCSLGELDKTKANRLSLSFFDGHSVTLDESLPAKKCSFCWRLLQ